MEESVWSLKHINILQSLSEGELMELGTQCAMMRYRQGDQIQINDTTRNIYFLKTGSMKVVKVLEDGTEHVKEVIEAGEIFGSFVGVESDSEERVMATGDAVVCYLSLERWQEFLRNHPVLEYGFIRWMGLRIRRLERKMDALYFKTTKQRIGDVLIDIMDRFGKRNKDGVTIVKLSLTHDELAQLTGTSRQTVNGLLNELREQGYIEYTRSMLKVYPAFFNEFNKG